MIYGFLLGLHIVVSIGLILVVLLQSGKGGGLAGAFGGMGGAGQSLFGGRGAATFLSKATTVLGVAFMTTSLILALIAGARSGPRSVVRHSTMSESAPPPSSAAPLQIPQGEEGLPPVEGLGGGETATPGSSPAMPPQAAPTPGAAGTPPAPSASPGAKTTPEPGTKSSGN